MCPGYLFFSYLSYPLPQDNWGGGVVVARFQEVEEFNFDLQEP